jgi:glycine cleavage system H lipoate-binding protein/ABC-type phosphate transport system substrate-binding protein
MKTKILIESLLILFFAIGISSNDALNAASQNDTINVFAVSGISNMAQTFVTEYGKEHPEQNFNVQTTNLSKFKDIMNTKNSLGFIAQRPDISMVSESMWRMSLGRNIAVATINNKNPFVENIDKTGISPKKLANIISGNARNTWGALLGNDQSEPIRFYILNDPSLKVSISKFLEVSPSTIGAIESKSAEEIVEILKNDKYAIAFSQLSSVNDINKQTILEHLKLLAIDKNENERIDYNENFYGTLSDFERAAWIGKYPKVLISNVYAVARVFPENENIVGFLNWINTKGQQFVEQNGYSELVYSEKQSNLNKLIPSVLLAEKTTEGNSKAQIFLILIIVITVIGIPILVFVRNRNKKSALFNTNPNHHKIFDENSLEIPSGLYYDKSHTWVFMEKNGEVKFGIDDFIPKVTGDYTNIILKSPGERVKRKELIVTLIQNGKQINISSPVSGTIKDINELLVTEPNMINHSPYNKGWVYSIEPSNWVREIHFFKLGEMYKEWIKNEFTRLKDFLACSFSTKILSETNIVYQEGGEITSEPLKLMGPEIWEDFQNYFIDASESY